MLIGFHHLVFILLATHFQRLFTDAFSANRRSNQFSNAALLSRLQTIQAELLLSIGRIPGTAMPPDWAASGAKLGFALEVEFTDETCEYEMSKETMLRGDALMGSTLMSVEPLNEPSFVSSNGREIVQVSAGAYGCQLQVVESKQYAFRFFLDFPEGAKRNDVELPPERIYFVSSCWLADDEAVIGRARRRKDEITKSIQQIERDLKDLEQDSLGFFQKAISFRKSFDLVERRMKFVSQLEELEQKYPLDSSKIIHGPNNIIFSKEGFVAVKRLRGTLGTREQYHWVGTFSFNEFFEGDEDDD